MASFSAELHVAGQSFPVTHCYFGVEQATHQRGRVSTKVRYGPVELVLSVPDGDILFGWANAPTKRLPAQVFFRDGDGGSVLETLSLQAAYCVAYHEQFVGGDAAGGAYQCQLTLSDPDGWTLAAGGPASALVVPAARAHGLPGAASALRTMAVGGGSAALAQDAAAVAWAAAKTTALDPTRIGDMYAAYVSTKKRKKEQPRTQQDWWGVVGKRGGARLTVEGCLGEYQADKLFAAQGHQKLNHDGQLCGLLDLPRGKGLDGVWRNAAPPPEFLITETKYTTTPGKAVKLSSRGQMSDKWVQGADRLTNALGIDEGIKMRRAMRDNKKVGKRLLHIDSDGKLHEYAIDAKGQFTPLKK